MGKLNDFFCQSINFFPMLILRNRSKAARLLDSNCKQPVYRRSFSFTCTTKLAC